MDDAARNKRIAELIEKLKDFGVFLTAPEVPVSPKEPTHGTSPYYLEEKDPDPWLSYLESCAGS